MSLLSEPKAAFQRQATEYKSGMKFVEGYLVPDTCSSEVLYLATKNAHPRDRFVCFSDVGHMYFVCGTSEGYVSTTGFIHSFFSDFPAEEHATRIVNRKDFRTNKRYQKYWSLVEGGKSGMLGKESIVQKIIQMWKRLGHEAAEKGTRIHRCIELYYNGCLPKSEKLPMEFTSHFSKYAKMMEGAGWKPYRTEWLIYDMDHKITGSVDAVFYHPKKKVWCIRDWKRSKKISKYGFGRRGKNGLNRLQDCNWMHYSLQLNIYKYFLELHYGVVIQDMAIVVLHENNKSYVEMFAQSMHADVEVMLQHRYFRTHPAIEDIPLLCSRV